MNKIEYYSGFILRTTISIFGICSALLLLVLIAINEFSLTDFNVMSFALASLIVLVFLLICKNKIDHKIIIEKRRWLAELKYVIGLIIDVLFILILVLNAFVLPISQDIYNTQTISYILVQIVIVSLYIYCGIVIGALVFLLFFQLTYPYTRKVASETSGVLISLIPVTFAYLGYIFYIYVANGSNFAFMSEYLIFVLLTFLTNLLIVFYYLQYYNDKIKDEKINSQLLRIGFASKLFTNLLVLPFSLIKYLGNFISGIFSK